MAQNKPNSAIRYSKIACCTAIAIGILLGILVKIFSHEISWFLVKEKEAMNYLDLLLNKFCYLVPLEIVTPILFGLVKAICRIRYGIYCVLVSNYVVYFSVYFYTLYYTNIAKTQIIFYTTMAMYIVLDGSLLAVCLLTNWKEQAQKIKNDFKAN